MSLFLSTEEARRLYEMLFDAKTASEAMSKRVEKFERALKSIAANTCCEPCQEAKLVALAAMKSEDDTLLRRPGDT